MTQDLESQQRDANTRDLEAHTPEALNPAGTSATRFTSHGVAPPISTAASTPPPTASERAFDAAPAPTPAPRPKKPPAKPRVIVHLHRYAAIDESTSSQEAHSEAGVAGPGGPLPHHAAIQSAFGAHDVSDVRAHEGPQAAQSANALGARAYATRDQVAFGEQPDLFTAAHEAAHVVQHRQGVQGVHRKAAVGEVGSVHEQHADAVATEVVAGRSAEGLLSNAPPAAPSVQRVEGNSWFNDGLPKEHSASVSGGSGKVADIFQTEVLFVTGDDTTWLDHTDRMKQVAADEATLGHSDAFDEEAHANADRIDRERANPTVAEVDITFVENPDGTTTMTMKAAGGATVQITVPNSAPTYDGFMAGITKLIDGFLAFRNKAAEDPKNPKTPSGPGKDEEPEDKDPANDPDPDKRPDPKDREEEEDDDVDQEEEVEEEGTPNPMAEDPSTGMPLWMMTDGRFDREGKANTDRAIATGRGGGVTDPGGDREGQSGPMMGDEMAREGKHIAIVGGSSVDGPDRPEPEQVSAEEQAAVERRIQGDAKDPAETSGPTQMPAAPIGLAGNIAGPAPKGLTGAALAAAQLQSKKQNR